MRVSRLYNRKNISIHRTINPARRFYCTPKKLNYQNPYKTNFCQNYQGRMKLSLIYASTLDHAISSRKNNSLLLVKRDQDHFKRVTQYSPCGVPNMMIVGRKTWETIPKQMRNCPMRDFIVLTSDKKIQDIPTKDNFRSALEFCMTNRNSYHKFFVIGGAEIYKEAMKTGLVEEIFHTQFQIDLSKELPDLDTVKCEINFDGYQINREHNEFSDLLFNYSDEDSPLKKTSIKCIYRHYVKNYLPFETQYLSLVENIITYGKETEARNGTTISDKDHSIKIDLVDGFPILTTRRSFWKGIKEELLWMMRGFTNVKILQDNGVHIWDGNSSREFLDECGLTHLKEGDIGPGYGFQMRHAGAKYVNCETDYTGQGVDQLVECINLIKNNPSSRRIMLNLWNVSQLNEMALPPCHFIYQFTVTDNKLSCHLYQRSWDIMLGWNTSTAALLTHILAHYCSLEPGTVTHTICDVHVYASHLDAYKTFKDRLPHKLPKLEILGPVPENISDYTSEQFKLVDYQSHPSVKMKMEP